jgi:hypothetical protein
LVFPHRITLGARKGVEKGVRKGGEGGGGTFNGGGTATIPDKNPNLHCRQCYCHHGAHTHLDVHISFSFPSLNFNYSDGDGVVVVMVVIRRMKYLQKVAQRASVGEDDACKKIGKDGGGEMIK